MHGAALCSNEAAPRKARVSGVRLLSELEFAGVTSCVATWRKYKINKAKTFCLAKYQ
jgi:hypothetical protein